MPPIPDESTPVSSQNLSSPDPHVPSRSSHSAPHSREASTVRGRPADAPVLASSSLQAHPSRRGNSHSKSPEASVRPAPGYDGGLERRPSNSYGHHRQTSIVHGIQHSRNPSYATSSNPLSPELMASLARNAGSESDNNSFIRPDQPDAHQTFTPGSASSHPAQVPLTTIDDQDPSGAPFSSANPLHGRMNSSGRQLREGSHSRSHSKHLSESKTVGEYALHHLFNSVGYPRH